MVNILIGQHTNIVLGSGHNYMKYQGLKSVTYA